MIASALARLSNSGTSPIHCTSKGTAYEHTRGNGVGASDSCNRPYFILAAAQRLSIRLHTTYDIG